MREKKSYEHPKNTQNGTHYGTHFGLTYGYYRNHASRRAVDVLSDGVYNTNVDAAAHLRGDDATRLTRHRIMHLFACGILWFSSPATGFVAALAVPSRSALRAAAAAAEANPRNAGLALQLDDGTRKAHSVAKNTAFVTGFFKGLSTKDEYAKLLTSLYCVYVAMEEAFDTTAEESVIKMDDANLRRVDAARVDMKYYFGEGWEKKIAPSRATKKYVSRIETIAKENPKLLIAHQYLRYLGDLFGDQMMGGMTRKSLNLSGGMGIRFYQFDGIDDNNEFITNWYSKLNALDLTEEEKQAIVDEANHVFALNIDIFNKLEGSAMKALVSFVWQTFKEKVGLAKP
jgi:heme oxygenase